MSAQINFTNFKPHYEIRSYISRVIEDIHDKSPSDANLVTKIKKQGKQFVVEVRLCSNLLRCTVRTTATTACEALDRAMTHVENRIFDWKASIA